MQTYNKTIILLSSKRTGSSAIFKVFKKHPSIDCLLKNKEMDMIELNFWNSALDAINGKPSSLKKVLKKINFNFKLPKKITKKKIFNIWDNILNKHKKIIFDKSPSYLNSIEILKLIKDYESTGRKIEFIGLIRNPKDSIVSQFELWDKKNNNTIVKSLKKREKKWLKYYTNLEIFMKERKFKIYRYEDLVKNKKLFKKIFQLCGLSYKPYYVSHIKPTSIGRFNLTLFKEVKKWKFSNKFKLHLKKYNYDKDNYYIGVSNRIKLYLSYSKRLLPLNLYLHLATIINFIKRLFGIQVHEWR